MPKVESAPGRALTRRLPAPRRRKSMGWSSTSHQNARRTRKTRTVRPRKRSCGLACGGIRGNHGFADNGCPDPEDRHGIEHNEAFPEIHVGELEPVAVVLA